MGIVPLHGARRADEDAEPTAAELRAIEREWPLIEAELALLDAEIRVLSAVGGPTALDWRRLRRAEHRTLAARTSVRRPARGGVASGPEVA